LPGQAELDEAARIIRPYAAHLVRGTDAVAADLLAYVELLKRWQRVQNLVSRETLREVWIRHIADSLQTLGLIRETDLRFVDFGSGGGLPAIPLAIALRDRGGAGFTLIEPNERKVSFLRTIARELKLPLEVIAARTDQIDSRETFAPDVITARALADLPSLCAMAAPFFAPQTRAIFHKGREHVEEVAKSRAFWRFDVVVVDSDTNIGSALLVLTNLRSKSVA
jgi:16S rRNA (guanine527-N7)-methyltransferase